MKQILQDLRSGQTIVADVPAPMCRPRTLRIATSVSVISSGTERMLVDFARGSLLSKAMQQPERVRDVLQKMRTDGLVQTLSAVRNKLDQPLALGYCSVGRVLEIGAGVGGFEVGDRVVSNGKHAETAVVPATLCVKVPDAVSDEAAAFSVLGAIALQGVRLAQPTLGEFFVVTGLGLIGLLTVQILRANGCRVLGIDSDPSRLALAQSFGAEIVDLAKGQDPVARAMSLSRGRGADGVLLTLSATSSEPVSQAAQLCRKRGRIILVGVTGLDLKRADFYEKEIQFQVSCSYGPGRYDPEYEDKGQDYPFGFVRWTEQRNFEAVLDLMASGAVQTAPLVSHRFAIEEAAQGYDVLVSGAPSLGILVSYPLASTQATATHAAIPVTRPERSSSVAGRAVLGAIGAGNYAGNVLLGCFKSAGADLHTLVSANGVTARHYGTKFGFRTVSSDAQAVLNEAAIDTVCIASRHDSHARYTIEALKRGKNVFAEKPLCLTHAELQSIEAAHAGGQHGAEPLPHLMVGFNRRFAPLVQRLMQLLQPLSAPRAITITVNAGAIPKDHWTQDPDEGGGRILGEACHFVDLARYIAGASITHHSLAAMRAAGGPSIPDTAIITLGFANQSIATIQYLANGHKSFPKERIEVFCGGSILQLDNFRALKGFGFSGFSGQSLWRQDKGQRACVAAFIDAIKRGGPPPIPLEDILEVSKVTIDLAHAGR